MRLSHFIQFFQYNFISSRYVYFTCKYIWKPIFRLNDNIAINAVVATVLVTLGATISMYSVTLCVDSVTRKLLFLVDTYMSLTLLELLSLLNNIIEKFRLI